MEPMELFEEVRVLVDPETVLDHVGCREAMHYFGLEEVIEEAHTLWGEESIVSHLERTCGEDPQKILAELDEDDVVLFLQGLGYNVEKQS